MNPSRSPLALVWLVLCAVIVFGSAAVSPTASAEAPFKQIRLTEDQVKSFLNAQTELRGAIEKLTSPGGEPDEQRLLAELDTIVKRHGFKDYDDHDAVAANIALIMSGIDPDTGEFSEPRTMLEKDLEEIKQDGSMNKADKKKILEEIEEALQATPKVEFAETSHW